MASVEIRDVRKSFGSTEILHGLDIDIHDESFVVLVGPSGCGKSTLLRMIAGLEEITSGDISIGGRVVNTMPPKERDIAMVFQNYALYPHISFRRMKSAPRAQWRSRRTGLLGGPKAPRHEKDLPLTRRRCHSYFFPRPLKADVFIAGSDPRPGYFLSGLVLARFGG